MNITRDALIMVLSHVDWTATGDANPDDLLCASMPEAIIRHARRALDQPEDAESIDSEMLVVLKSTLSWLTSYPGGGAIPCWERARVVVDKAEAIENSLLNEKLRKSIARNADKMRVPT